MLESSMEKVAGSDSLAGKGKVQGCYPVLAIFVSLLCVSAHSM